MRPRSDPDDEGVPASGTVPLPTPDVLAHMLEGVYVVDRERRITYWNAAAEEITGFPATEVVGHACADRFLHHVDEFGHRLCHRGCPLERTISTGEQCDTDVYLQHREGHRRRVRLRTIPLRDSTGITGAVEMFVAEEGSLALEDRVRELERLAFTDPLTGLANRRYLETALVARLAELTRYGWPFGVLLLDLDRFKQVNDTHGHAAGDRVLQTVSKTIKGALRPFDVAGRLGGEEFLLVLGHVDVASLRAVAERVRALVEKTDVRINDDHRIEVTVSAGGALARSGDTPTTLISRADALMYQSKDAGRNKVVVEP